MRNFAVGIAIVVAAVEVVAEVVPQPEVERAGLAVELGLLAHLWLV
jgi:hypothetical protein